MSEALLQFVSIVPKDTPLGRRLAKFTPFGLKILCSDFEVRFSIQVEINECDDEPSVHGARWLDFPRYEITFRVLRPDLLHEFEQLAFESGTPEPEK